MLKTKTSTSNRFLVVNYCFWTCKMYLCLCKYYVLLNSYLRVMKLLEMSQVGRYYYDPKRPAPIPQHRLELWPGYITSIQAYEGQLPRLLFKLFAILWKNNLLGICRELLNISSLKSSSKIKAKQQSRQNMSLF